MHVDISLPNTPVVGSDYCLWTFRREDCADPLSTYQQRLKEVYTPPEAQSGSQEPTLSGDVFR